MVLWFILLHDWHLGFLACDAKEDCLIAHSDCSPVNNMWNIWNVKYEEMTLDWREMCFYCF